ncbi:DHB8 dehydrogenase, partial [Caloenas nicobarica]|nr:DHB8 dehydrogenase [Caloenas nicobarica]
QGTFLVTQAVARALVATGAPGGSIVHVGSVVGKVGNLGQVHYAAAKAGVQGLTRSCAKELASLQGWCRWDVSGTLRTWPMSSRSWHPPRAATSRGPVWR